MSLYDSIMHRGGGAAAPGAGAVTDPLTLPELTPDMYSKLWPEGTTSLVSSTVSGDGGTVGAQRIGQGPYANKALPVDEGGGGKATRIVKAAQSMLGLPYVWGGTSASSGVDCSGLVQLAYKAAGINLPRVSAAQAQYGRRVALDNLRPGDLVAWDNSSRNGGADHIAVYIGGGRIIEAPRPGGHVQVAKLYDTSQAWGVRIL